MEIYAVDLDEEIISHLANPESVQLLRTERLDPLVIEDNSVREIYTWQMNYLREHGRPATPSVLADEWDLNLEEPLTEIGYLIERLRERFVRNNAREYMERLAKSYQADPLGVPTTMIEVGRDLGRIVNTRGESYGNDDYDRVMHEYDKKLLSGSGASFGFQELDDYFYGMRGVAMWIGSPKSMKSWVSAKAVLSNVLAGKKVFHYPLELPAHEMTERFYALASGIPPWKFLKGKLTKEDRDTLREVVQAVDESGLYRIEKPPEGLRGIDYLVDHARDFDADVIIIDQLQYVEYKRGYQLGNGSPGDYWHVLNKARDLSDEGPIAFVHQFNRETRFMDEMPTMQYAKGAAACEEVASLILALWANKDMRHCLSALYGANLGNQRRFE
jgi:hypothetical protein